MRITSENERVYYFGEQGNLTIRERERGWWKGEVHIQAGEAIIIQNVSRF